MLGNPQALLEKEGALICEPGWLRSYALRISKAWESSVISPNTKEQVSLAKCSFRAPSNFEMPYSVNARLESYWERKVQLFAGLVLSGGGAAGPSVRLCEDFNAGGSNPLH